MINLGAVNILDITISNDTIIRKSLIHCKRVKQNLLILNGHTRATEFGLFCRSIVRK
jgi:hypothetical protein